MGIGETHGLLPLEDVLALEPADDRAFVVAADLVPAAAALQRLALGAGIDEIGLEGGQVALQNRLARVVLVQGRQRPGEHAQRQGRGFAHAYGQAFGGMGRAGPEQNQEKKAWQQSFHESFSLRCKIGCYYFLNTDDGRRSAMNCTTVS